MGDHADPDGYRDEVLGPAWKVQLGDLHEWHVLKASCFRCKHSARLSTTWLKRRRLRLAKKRSPRVPDHISKRDVNLERLTDLEHKLRCTHCGNRELNTWKTQRIPRNV